MGEPTTIGHFWFAATPFSPVHDDDGNLTDDGRWYYLWNAENRLIQMETTPQAITAGHPYTKVVNAYDWQGRRIAKHVWQGGTAANPSFSSSTRWLYNGWNQIAEFSANSDTSTTLTREKILTWGLDLSGSLQGAGGVGGLLVQTTVASGVKEGTSYDGNGNIVAWTKSNATTPTARREYDAFGNTLVSEGTWPSRFGFSTKQQDAETGLYYYGYRYYDPVTGRWPSRDPVEEEGGVNLYSLLGNDGINKYDILGLNPYYVSKSMSAMGWPVSAALMNLWMNKPSNNNPLSDKNESIVTMNWALGFSRAKQMYDELYTGGGYKNESEKTLLSKRLYAAGITNNGQFGNLSLPASQIEAGNVYVNTRPNHDTPLDDMGGALGEFQMRVAVQGHLMASDSRREFCLEKIGLYIKDSYDFNTPFQPLGFWDFNNNRVTKNPVIGVGGSYVYESNATFRDWRMKTGMGGDFTVFSDVKVLSVNDVIILK